MKKYLKTKLLNIKDRFLIPESDSFVSLVVLEGNAVLSFESEELQFKKGDSIFVPAKFSVTLTGNAEILYSYV